MICASCLAAISDFCAECSSNDDLLSAGLDCRKIRLCGSDSFAIVQGGGPTRFHLKYSGPDTYGNMVYIRSESGKPKSLPERSPSSNFKMRMYESSKPLRRIPSFDSVKLIGSTDGIPVINFRNGGRDFKNVISALPSRDYVWQIFGGSEIELAGRYLFCLTSNDGSRLFIDKWIAVNNDGLHGDYTVRVSSVSTLYFAWTSLSTRKMTECIKIS